MVLQYKNNFVNKKKPIVKSIQKEKYLIYRGVNSNFWTKSII